MPSDYDQQDLKRWAKAQLAGFDEEEPEGKDLDEALAESLMTAAKDIAEVAEEIQGAVDEALVERLQTTAALLQELAGEEAEEDDSAKDNDSED